MSAVLLAVRENQFTQTKASLVHVTLRIQRKIYGIGRCAFDDRFCRRASARKRRRTFGLSSNSVPMIIEKDVLRRVTNLSSSVYRRISKTNTLRRVHEA